MCGNVVVDLDAVFGKFQFTFLTEYSHSQYETAAQILYQANSSLPATAQIKDMPQFKLHAKHLKAELASFSHAKDYCDHWAARVWAKLAEYRDKMLRNYLDDD